LHGKKRAKSSKKRGVRTMARRTVRRRSGARGILGGGMINNVLKAAGATTVVNMIAPGILGQFTAPAAGFLVAGPIGAITGYLMGGGLGGIGGSTGSGAATYG